MTAKCDDITKIKKNKFSTIFSWNKQTTTTPVIATANAVAVNYSALILKKKFIKFYWTWLQSILNFLHYYWGCWAFFWMSAVNDDESNELFAQRWVFCHWKITNFYCERLRNVRRWLKMQWKNKKILIEEYFVIWK